MKNQHPDYYPSIKRFNKFIINADDFGMNHSINAAIVNCFALELISSTSLLPNMSGFQDAVQAAHSNAGLKQRIGIHINLTEGIPLTGAIKACRKFCDENGYFISNGNRPFFILSKDEKKAVYAEIKAQVQKVINAGITPTHIDSHHHIHTELGISKILLLVLKESGINKIRCSRNLGIKNTFSKEVYKKAFNYSLIYKSGFKTTNYFGSITDLQHSDFRVTPKGKLIEIMVHPMYSETGELVDDDNQNLSDKLNLILEKAKIICYNEF